MGGGWCRAGLLTLCLLGQTVRLIGEAQPLTPLDSTKPEASAPPADVAPAQQIPRQLLPFPREFVTPKDSSSTRSFSSAWQASQKLRFSLAEPAELGVPSPAQQVGQEREVSWKLLAPNFLHDQKRIWVFPLRAAEGKHWRAVLGVVAGTAALVALDPHDTPYFGRTSAFHDFNKAFSGLNTGILEGVVPLGLLLAGEARKDSPTEKTGLLAAEAWVDAEVVAEGMKNIDRRLRPSDISTDGDFTHTWFKARGGILISRGSFPSGHAIGAFGLASVLAERYRQHRWVSWVAYGLAGTIAFSRVTLQAHFPSDVFAGAALGYFISHDVVLRGRN